MGFIKWTTAKIDQIKKPEETKEKNKKINKDSTKSLDKK